MRVVLADLPNDQVQPRIRKEARAIERMFQLVEDGTLSWIASKVLLEEMANLDYRG